MSSSPVIPVPARNCLDRVKVLSGVEIHGDRRATLEDAFVKLLRLWFTESDQIRGIARREARRHGLRIPFRRGALLARSRPTPVAVRITEDTLGQFLDGVAAAMCRYESSLVRRSSEPRVRVALRAVFPSRVEVDPESPITRPAVWVPPGDPSGGPSSPGAPAQLGAGTPTPPPPSDPDDGVDLD